ncbi:MAG: phage integrase SAM-like domain-containing protein [Bacteroidales bacterium]|nr:phage integrase SAM-like domain-containing protein [Bacteroidales bacterium]
MITYKPTIDKGGRRRDGTYPVKIRVIFKRQVRRLPTTLVCRDGDITRSGKIKNETINARAGELIDRMRSACSELSPFVLADWNIDELIDYIKRKLSNKKFSLDFFEFADEYINVKSKPTRKSYESALNAFTRYLGKRKCDINDISHRMMLDFVKWYEEQPAVHLNQSGLYVATRRHKIKAGASSMYIAKLAHIFNAAKFQYNDEDAESIVIPRNPFYGFQKAYPESKGQPPLDVEVIQRMIDAKPIVENERIALALFMLSFVTMGANMADLWAARPIVGDIWKYNRQKTGAPAQVKITEQARFYASALGGEGEWWLPQIHRWKSIDSATINLNKSLRRWAEREGIESFTFYSARHTWATLARKLKVEKATVDEALTHKGEYRMADIYAERNWELSWEANRKVLALFRWNGCPDDL